MRRLKSYFHGIQSKCCEEKCRIGAEQTDGGLLNCQQVALYPSYRPCCCECRKCEPMNCGALLFLWLQLPAPVHVSCVCNLRGRRLKASSLSPHLDMEVAGHVVGTPVCDKCLMTCGVYQAVQWPSATEDATAWPASRYHHHELWTCFGSVQATTAAFLSSWFTLPWYPSSFALLQSI